MGRKQQRRRAKKSAQVAGLVAAGEPTLKCTACRQVISIDTSVACPVPECDRIFCTQRCSSKCILHCDAPGCPNPNRCRPCATGQTYAMLERRYERRDEQLVKLGLIHEGLHPCEADGCRNMVCGQCHYLSACSRCEKLVCLESCEDRDIVTCYSCHDQFCRDCEPNFDDVNARCSQCATIVDHSSVTTTCDSDDATDAEASVAGDEILQPWMLVEPREVDMVVLEYARVLEKVLPVLVAFLSSRNCSEDTIAASRLARSRVMEAYSQEKLFINFIATITERYSEIRCLLDDEPTAEEFLSGLKECLLRNEIHDERVQRKGALRCWRRKCDSKSLRPGAQVSR